MCVNKQVLSLFPQCSLALSVFFEFQFQSHTVCVNNLVVWEQCKQLLTWIPQQPTSSTTQTCPLPYISGLSCCVSFTVMQHCTETIPVDFPPLDLASYPHQQWNIISHLPVYFSYYSQICSGYPRDFHSHCSWLGFPLGVCCTFVSHHKLWLSTARYGHAPRYKGMQVSLPGHGWHFCREGF